MILQFVSFLFVFVFCAEATIAQCTSSDTVIYGVYYPITRLDGNNVWGYSETTIVGSYRNYWRPYITGYMSRNGSQIGSPVGELGPGSNGGTQSVTMTPTLSVWGPGTYSMRAFHRAFNWVCGYWVPPYSNGWDGNSYSSPNLTVERPVISRTVVPYFLGPGVVSSNDYSSQTQMSVNSKGAPETPQWRFESGSTYGTLNCTNCASPIYQATAPGSSCGAYNVVLKASFNGFDSEAFYIDNQSPNLLQYVRTDHYIPPQGGWQSEVFYRVQSGCNIQMTNVQANEVFLSWSQFNGSNWDAPLEATGFSNLAFDSGTGSWLLRDILYEVPVVGKTPQPMNAGTNGLSIAQQWLMTQHLQKWRIGSTDNGGSIVGGPRQGNDATAKGVVVGSNPHYHYIDHGSH
ncbi:MAG: hypothetical protein NTZ56_22700 [Acidobacteria bacterium]|nr:hypothetical protein [Acidobacteriota bacterium]